MGPTKRARQTDIPLVSSTSPLSQNPDHDVDMDKFRLPKTQPVKLVVCCIALVLLAASLVHEESTEAHLVDHGSGEIWKLSAAIPDVTYTMHLRKADQHADKSNYRMMSVALGPHSVDFSVKVSNCRYPRFWMRLVGDALVGINLVESGKDNRTWRGTFSIPVPGQYTVESRWYGCRDAQSFRALESDRDAFTFHAAGDLPRAKDSVFADGAWIQQTSKTLQDLTLPPYLWMDPRTGPKAGSYISTSDSVVLREGVAREPGGFYSFAELGNYELLCFMGSQSMEHVHREFLDMRGKLFPAQRPFKFHMYSIPSFVRPDRNWTIETKTRLRKCKHIVVLLDETVDPVDQSTYREQVTTFVHHLSHVIPDSTFPIWFSTVNKSAMNVTNCHTPKMPRTSHHPCNDVLHALFAPGASPSFPARFHLLDNTDLMLPHWDTSRHVDVLAVIALRIYVLCGRGVADWRAQGQAGKIDGLHRNGKVEPNFELVPYTGWS